MSSFEALLMGRRLGERYSVEAVLGVGGMGAVYRAHDERLNRPVALKVMNLGRGSAELHEKLRRQFRREATMASQLHHPGIVTVHDFGVDPELDLDYIVMELLSGTDLARYLADHGPPAPAFALSFLRQAARALAAGHRAGLIHRDIKPANLFVAETAGEEPRIVLLDFGIALINVPVETLTHSRFARGAFSPAYAAPEQLAGMEVTPACDVFSLGVTMFELFIGERVARGGEPAGSEGPVRAVREILAGKPHVFPAGVSEVLHRALASTPDARFQDAIELVSALEGLETEPPRLAAPIRAEPGQGAARSKRSLRREFRWLPAMGAATVVALAVLAGWRISADRVAQTANRTSAGPAVLLPPGTSASTGAASIQGTGGPDARRSTPASTPVAATVASLRPHATASDIGPPAAAPVDSVGIYSERGYRMYNERQYAEAEASYRDAIRLNTNHGGLHYMLAQVLMGLERYADAEASYRESVRLRPDDASTLRSLGLLQLRLQHYRDAEASFRAVVRLESDRSEHHWYLGRALLAQRRYPEAETSYREAIRLYPYTAAYHNHLGFALGQQRRFAEAETSYRRAVQLDPNRAEFHADLGFGLNDLNRKAEAAESLQEAVRLQPANAGWREMLGLILGNLKRFEESEEQLAEAVRLEPGNTDFRAHLGTIRREAAAARTSVRSSCGVVHEGCTVTFSQTPP